MGKKRQKRRQKRGIEKGKVEGELNALKTVIINQAKQKFGSIENSTEEKIKNISQKDKLEEIVTKLINLDCEKELLKVIDKQKKILCLNLN